MVDRLAAHEIAEIRKAFSVFDVDGDGAITSKELADVMRSFGLNPSEDELMDMINKFDIDGDGMVSFPEFLQMMAPNEDDYQKDIYDVMRLFDPNNNGFIDLREIQNILMQFGSTELQPTQEDVLDIQEMINELKRAADWSADSYVIRTEDAVTLLSEETLDNKVSATEKSAKLMISHNLIGGQGKATMAPSSSSPAKSISNNTQNQLAVDTARPSNRSTAMSDVSMDGSDIAAGAPVNVRQRRLQKLAQRDDVNNARTLPGAY